MIGERRADSIFRKCQYTMTRLVGRNSTFPINQQIQFKVSCLVWMLKQKYIGEESPRYITKKEYNKDLEQISMLESKITDGAFKADAVQTVADAREYLDIIARHKVRQTNSTRVY